MALCLSALWALLLLNTIVRLRDPCGHLSYRAFVYDGYRRHNNYRQLATSAICALQVMSVFLANATLSVWVLAPGAVFGAHLIAGVIVVVRNINTMHFDDEEVDPCWQTLVLALTWPVWMALARLRTADR